MGSNHSSDSPPSLKTPRTLSATMASTGHNVIDHLEDGDERQYKAADYAETRRTTGVNVQGYKSEADKVQEMNNLADQDIQRKIAEREKHDPTYRATAHGNEPSRGAKIQAEEAEMLKKKNAQGTDSMPGKKF